MISNEAALIRKVRKNYSKCDSPCQVVPMLISTKIGYQTEISQLKSYRVRSSLKTVLSGWSDKLQVFWKNSQRISKLSPQMVSKSLAKLIWVLVKDIVQGNVCITFINRLNSGRRKRNYFFVWATFLFQKIGNDSMNRADSGDIQLLVQFPGNSIFKILQNFWKCVGGSYMRGCSILKIRNSPEFSGILRNSTYS